MVEGEDTKMPLLDHLVELRSRLILSLASIIILFVAIFPFAEHVYQFLVQPLADIFEEMGGQRRLIFTALHEAFFTYIKLSLVAALFIAFPFISIQFWMFVAPGLYKKEKGAFLPYLVVTPILFLMGSAMVYYIVMPIAWQFFASFQTLGNVDLADELPVELLPRVSEYLSLSMRLIFAFGLAFQLPVAITLLARAGLTTSEGLKKKRRYSIVLAFIAAAILTPPDPLSQIGLAIPIIILYEISIWCARLVEKRREDES